MLKTRLSFNSNRYRRGEAHAPILWFRFSIIKRHSLSSTIENTTIFQKYCCNANSKLFDTLSLTELLHNLHFNMQITLEKKSILGIKCLKWNSAGNYMFKVKNRNSKTRSEVCPQLTLEITHWKISSVWVNC